ncbi:MAG: nucleotidyltransferase domain-containing protein [Spirochaetia bacterium]|jgi:predicted nucleotidyltransferase|nr:nucleotidyltransferase domain-containing protein [Spirochaetia bacterium]
MDFIEKIKRTVYEYFENENTVLAVFLLGSAARNELTPDSDIDLAVMKRPGLSLSSTEKYDIAASLSYKLEKIVNVGELSSQNLVYANEVLLTGYPVFKKNDDLVGFISANLLALYIQSGRGRREVSDTWHAR